MISSQAELPGKKHCNVQCTRGFPAENHGIKQVRDIVRDGR